MLRYEAWTAVMREENDEISERKETLHLFLGDTFVTTGSGIWQIRQALKKIPLLKSKLQIHNFIPFYYLLYFTDPQYCRGIHNLYKIALLEHIRAQCNKK